MILDDVDGDSSNILWSMARTTILNYGVMEKCLHKTIELSDERAIYQDTILCNGYRVLLFLLEVTEAACWHLPSHCILPICAFYTTIK